MFKFIKRLFKKNTEIDKPQKVKMDFSNVNFNFNIKSICAFEKLADKSFFQMADEDVLLLLYSIYMVSNPDKPMRMEMFFSLLEREDIAKWFIHKYTSITNVIGQFKAKEEDIKNVNTDTEKITRLTDYVTTLVVEYGIDIHYINYEMDIWEFTEYFEAIDTKVKKDALDKRFWAYVGVMPHIDTKKCKGPEYLVPYDWEKESIKKKKETELKNNMYAIKHTIGKSIFGDKNG